MNTLLPSFLAVASAVLTHLGVRAVSNAQRKWFIGGACLAFFLAALTAAGEGGFWTGFYTMLAVYILTTTLSPWIVFLWNRRRAG